jgi:hypothetical protein
MKSFFLYPIPQSGTPVNYPVINNRENKQDGMKNDNIQKTIPWGYTRVPFSLR